MGEDALGAPLGPLLAGSVLTLTALALAPRRWRRPLEAVALLLIGASSLASRLHAPVPAATPAPMPLTVTAAPLASGPTCLLRVHVQGRQPGAARLRARGEPCLAVPGQRWLAQVELWPPRPPSNPGATDRRRRWARRGVHALGRIREAAPIGAAPRGPRAVLERLRRRVADALDPPAGGVRAGPLLRALATGDRTRLAPEVRDAFRRSGTAHLLAVSGLHVALLFGLVRAGLAVLLRTSRGVAVLRRVDVISRLAGIAAALGYAALAGLGVPALRAAVMAFAGALAVLGGRPTASLNALALAALVVLALEPAELFEPRLALSFAAVLGILAWRPQGWALSRLLGCTLGASLATAPLLAALGAPLPAGGLVANALAVPWFGAVVVPLALLCGGLGALAPGLAALLRSVAVPCAELGIRAVEALASPDLLAGREGPVAFATLLAAGGLAARLAALGRLHAAVALALAGASAAPLVGPPEPRWQGLASLLFLDVGHGDATLVRSGAAAWLVDAGPRFGGFDAGRAVVLPALRHERVARLDVLVVTHADGDHAGGAVAVVEALPVDELWLSQAAAAAPGLRPLRRAAARRGVPIRLVAAGERARLGALRARVLWPPAGAVDLGTNLASVVLRLEGPAACAVLPADVPARVERRLAAGQSPCELLKLAHHGSASSSDPHWLERLAPGLAVASAGRRTAPLPAPAVRRRLAAASVTLYETHRFGALRVVFTGAATVAAPHLIPTARVGPRATRGLQSPHGQAPAGHRPGDLAPGARRHLAAEEQGAEPADGPGDRPRALALLRQRLGRARPAHPSAGAARISSAASARSAATGTAGAMRSRVAAPCPVSTKTQRQPAFAASSTSAGVSPITQLRARSAPSSRRARSSIPVAGLRSGEPEPGRSGAK